MPIDRSTQIEEDEPEPEGCESCRNVESLDIQVVDVQRLEGMGGARALGLRFACFDCDREVPNILYLNIEKALRERGL